MLTNVQIKELSAIAEKVTKIEKTKGVISVRNNEVHLTADAFKETFSEYEIDNDWAKNIPDKAELSTNVGSVKFFALIDKELPDITKDIKDFSEKMDKLEAEDEQFS